MKLYRQDEVTDDGQGLLCRQSRFAGIVRLVIWCGVLAVPPAIGWKLDKPWLVWTFVAVAAVVIPMALLDLAATWRSTNWLLRIGSDGVWINLLSYREKVIDPDALSVVRLDYGEIASAGQHTELYTTPSQPNSDVPTEWRDHFLEIELNHDRTDELKAALNDLRFPPAPAEAPAGQVSVRCRVSPVWLVSPSLLRIGWVSGHGPAVLPRLATALAHLEGSVRVAEPTRRERPKWRKMTPEEATDLAGELVQVHGATFPAAELLSRVGGMSRGQASTQIQQFEQEGIAPGARRHVVE